MLPSAVASKLFVDVWDAAGFWRNVKSTVAFDEKEDHRPPIKSKSWPAVGVHSHPVVESLPSRISAFR